ncbi:RidA family protein [Prosthecochloris sp. N3]|uniref:RidA family protein n=1 Tax=Prosthecochloris ethylica TaxID=2743976 RepID=A0ABR9XQL1_9CHLB|nr:MULTISPECIES: RidA family protein [Prosthecochloris]MEC9487023.1 RidA family protein [Prosthecochloris sp.]MBF0585401.1 RidA family protein [Prosthecochloris ethylica]MBF0636187.1 RidA family protein [Prosthecochloris ethylica]NUK46630.1 RidA family protein [Prosthecochloris ethylica]RNA64758.1 RidA family protein [Prosthecochloris sp. ZM_2]
MANKFDVKERAKDILEETLDREAVNVLATISQEMQMIFKDNPDPSREDVVRIVTEYFTGDGKSEHFISNWITTAQEHSRSRGLSEKDQPKAMLSDLGVFRFMNFLKEQGLTEDQVTIVLRGAVQQAADQDG